MFGPEECESNDQGHPIGACVAKEMESGQAGGTTWVATKNAALLEACSKNQKGLEKLWAGGPILQFRTFSAQKGGERQ